MPQPNFTSVAGAIGVPTCIEAQWFNSSIPGHPNLCSEPESCVLTQDLELQ